MREVNVVGYKGSGELRPGLYVGSDDGEPCKVTVLAVDHATKTLTIRDWPFEDVVTMEFRDWEEMAFEYLLMRSPAQPINC